MEIYQAFFMKLAPKWGISSWYPPIRRNENVCPGEANRGGPGAWGMVRQEVQGEKCNESMRSG